MEFWIAAALFLPLFSSLLLFFFPFLFPKEAGGWSATITVLAAFLLFALSLQSLVENNYTPTNITLYTMIPLSGIETAFSLKGEALSLWMALIITGVGGVIHLFSIGYMKDDPYFTKYFSYLNFFVFSMLLLVLSQDLVLLFFGWEGVGIASYLLIGFWYEEEAARKGAEKAMVVNRTCDFAFMIAIVWIITLSATSHLDAILMTKIESSSLFSIGLLLFIAASGKSAQVPFQLWLPDAMAGPTPVSALIHAATMVTAGVFLIVKMSPLFLQVPELLHLIALIGGITALYGALAASAQIDLKRVLAYSTISQLGFMFVAVGLGAFYTAIFHLTTHAFMKALLFLTAGNVIHSLSGETSMEKMGGLLPKMRRTSLLFLIGVLAMAGIPPLSAFFSKDLILEEGWATGFVPLFIAALIASFLTAFYLVRAFCLTFLGKRKAEHIDKVPWTMYFPTYLLALLTIAGGVLGVGFGYVPPLEKLLHQLPISPLEQEISSSFSWTPPVIISTVTALFGVLLSFFIYTRSSSAFANTLPLLREAFYIDLLVEKGIVIPYARTTKLLRNWIEEPIFWSSITKTGEAIFFFGKIAKKMQSGLIRSYAAWIVIGSTLALFFLVFGRVIL